MVESFQELHVRFLGQWMAGSTAGTHMVETKQCVMGLELSRPLTENISTEELLVKASLVIVLTFSTVPPTG